MNSWSNLKIVNLFNSIEADRLYIGGIQKLSCVLNAVPFGLCVSLLD